MYFHDHVNNPLNKCFKLMIALNNAFNFFFNFSICLNYCSFKFWIRQLVYLNVFTGFVGLHATSVSFFFQKCNFHTTFLMLATLPHENKPPGWSQKSIFSAYRQTPRILHDKQPFIHIVVGYFQQFLWMIENLYFYNLRLFSWLTED